VSATPRRSQARSPNLCNTPPEKIHPKYVQNTFFDVSRCLLEPITLFEPGGFFKTLLDVAGLPLQKREAVLLAQALLPSSSLPSPTPLEPHQKTDRSPSYQAVGIQHGSESPTERNHLLQPPPPPPPPLSLCWVGVACGARKPYANHPPAARGGVLILRGNPPSKSRRVLTHTTTLWGRGISLGILGCHHHIVNRGWGLSSCSLVLHLPIPSRQYSQKVVIHRRFSPLGGCAASS
jgi:hypothetical protein